MMDFDPRDTSILLVRALECGPPILANTDAFWSQVDYSPIKKKTIPDIFFFCLANVTLSELPRNVSRLDIVCPGDMIPYRCDVHTNSETLQLTWQVTFPEQDTITIVYTNDSDWSSMDVTNMSIITTLVPYRNDEFISSELTLIIIRNSSMNGTIIGCISSEELANQFETVDVDTAGTLKGSLD